MGKLRIAISILMLAAISTTAMSCGDKEANREAELESINKYLKEEINTLQEDVDDAKSKSQSSK